MPNLPGIDPQVRRVMQDMTDRINFLTGELDRVKGIAMSASPGVDAARKETPGEGIVIIPSPAGDGFIRVNKDGVIVSYTNPTIVPGMHRNLFLEYTANVTVANTTTETSLLGPGDFGSTKVIDPSIAVVGRTFRLYFSGIASNTGTPSLDMRLKLGGTTIYQFTPVISIGPGQPLDAWEIDLYASVTGVSSLTGHAGEMAYSFSTSGAQGVAHWSARNSNAISVTFSSYPQWDLTTQWGTANAANTLTYKFGCIDIVR